MLPGLDDDVACVLPMWHISRRRLIPHIEQSDVDMTIQVFEHPSVLTALNDPREIDCSPVRLLV